MGGEYWKRSTWWTKRGCSDCEITFLVPLLCRDVEKGSILDDMVGARKFDNDRLYAFDLNKTG